MISISCHEVAEQSGVVIEHVQAYVEHGIFETAHLNVLPQRSEDDVRYLIRQAESIRLSLNVDHAVAVMIVQLRSEIEALQSELSFFR